MGNGQIGGNGSVEWIFVHHDPDGLPVGLTLGPGVGGNDNNHVVLRNTNKQARGLDPIAASTIGTTRGLNNAGRFRVTLTFPDISTRDDALAWTTSQGKVGNSLVLTVPAIDRSLAANVGLPVEIRIDW